MTRYIDVDEIIKYFTIYENEEWTSSELEGLLNNAPIIDAVEVVRCGHCEYWKRNPNTKEYGVCKKASYDNFEVIMNSDDFCSYGNERKVR